MEALQWLAQEITQLNGQAVVMHVQQFEGLTEQQLIDLFREARREDYVEIKTQIAALEQEIAAQTEDDQQADIQDKLAKLQRQYGDIRHIDYFDSPEGAQVAAQLAQLAHTLAPAADPASPIAPVTVEAYQASQWVTRPQPHVDRLACAWFIRRFINPEAVIRYSHQPQANEVAFDMPEAEFSHTGNLCTFETMLRAFNVTAPGLPLLAEIVHAIDLQDERYFHPEIAGVEAILKGWLELGWPDSVLEQHGLALFEGLLAALSNRF